MWSGQNETLSDLIASHVIRNRRAGFWAGLYRFIPPYLPRAWGLHPYPAHPSRRVSHMPNPRSLVRGAGYGARRLSHAVDASRLALVLAGIFGCRAAPFRPSHHETLAHATKRIDVSTAPARGGWYLRCAFCRDAIFKCPPRFGGAGLFWWWRLPAVASVWLYLAVLPTPHDGGACSSRSAVGRSMPRVGRGASAYQGALARLTRATARL